MTTMKLSECKKFMCGYRELEEKGIIKFDWRTTARWSLRHSWEHEENGNLHRQMRDLRHERDAAIIRAERAEAALTAMTERAERADEYPCIGVETN